MEDFTIELAGIPVRIRCKYKTNKDFFEGYFSDKEPLFTVEKPSLDQLKEAQADFDRIAEAEGEPKIRCSQRFLENTAIHKLLAEELIDYDILLFHGSALEFDGEGIVFSAKSGTGKSTHARLWREIFGSRVRMINDDKPLIRVDEMRIYGTPWNGKHGLGDNISAPLKAIVKIERAQENRIIPINPRDAMRLLMDQAYFSQLPERKAHVLDLEMKLVENVSFYRLECNMDPEAARVAGKALTGTITDPENKGAFDYEKASGGREEFENRDAFESKDAFEYLETLRVQGNKDRNYEKVLKYLDAKAREKNVPIFGQFELTPLCNLNCKMCYVHLSPDKMSGQKLLSVDEWKRLIREAFDEGMLEVALTGGECLTYPGFDEIYFYLQSLGCQVTVMTNGVLLDEERLEFFKKHPPALIQVTLYGNSDDTYERVTGSRVFTKVLANLKSVKKVGIPLYLSITPNTLLGEDVFETIRFARQLSKHVKITTSLFAPPGEEWRLAECREPDPEFMVRILKFDNELRGFAIPERAQDMLPAPGGPKHSCKECGLECGGGRSGFVINWKGEILICNRMEAKGFPLRDGFATSWKEINSVANSWVRVPECIECAYENVCDKCAANFKQYAEPGKQPEDYCKIIKYMVSKGVFPAPEC